MFTFNYFNYSRFISHPFIDLPVRSNGAGVWHLPSGDIIGPIPVYVHEIVRGLYAVLTTNINAPSVPSKFYCVFNKEKSAANGLKYNNLVTKETPPGRKGYTINRCTTPYGIYRTSISCTR